MSKTPSFRLGLLRPHVSPAVASHLGKGLALNKKICFIWGHGLVLVLNRSLHHPDSVGVAVNKTSHQ